MSKCNSCKYRAGWNYGPEKVYCAYILATGHRRPCPAKDCTEYKRGAKPFRDDIKHKRVVI